MSRMKHVPGKKEILEILRKHGQSRDKIGHVQAVADLALTTADSLAEHGIKVNKQILEAGALLHDVGLTRTSARTEKDETENPEPEHGVYGAQIALDLGFPVEVADCIQAHVAQGMSLEEGRELGVPPPAVGTDYAPRSTEAKIVTFCDTIVYMMVYLKGQFDPWKDPEEAAMAIYPQLRDLYLSRAGKNVTIRHPICRRAVDNVRQFIKYVERDDVPRPWPGMAEIQLPKT